MQILIDSSIPLSGAGETLARNLIARLDSVYPAFVGYWRVIINEQGGTVEVTNMMLSGKMGFLLHIATLDPEGRKVVRAAGELLERYMVSRSKAMDIRDMAVRRNNIGELVYDV